jgi:hypothetical protein
MGRKENSKNGDNTYLEKKCKICGRKYKVWPYRILSNFCSKKCADKSKNKQVKLTCHFCNKTFYRRNSLHKYNLVRGQKNQFCSKSCVRKYQYADFVKEIVCLNCGKKIRRSINRIEQNKYNFCSVFCKTEYRRKYHIPKSGELFNDRGYLAIYIKSRGKVQFHRYVMEQKLGRRLNPDEFVHHKNGDKKDNRLVNLELTNNFTHGKLHSKFKQIKIDKADKVFSLFIRERDNWKCVRCSRVFGGSVCVGGLHNSHYFGRARENTRFDPDNCDALCFGCHQEWGSNDREAYREFKIKQLGENRFKILTVAANTYKKKDRDMDYIIWKKSYLQLCEEKNVEPREC